MVVTACAPAQTPSAAALPPTPTTASESPTATAIAEVATNPANAPTDWATTATLEGDYYVLGNPAAPVRLIDYSDFL
jgi:hypothetical protein